MKPGEKRSYTILKEAKRLRAERNMTTSSVSAIRHKKKHHISAYILFSKEKLSTLSKEIPFKERQAAVAKLWKTLPPLTKAKYQTAARNQRNKGYYHIVLTLYLWPSIGTKINSFFHYHQNKILKIQLVFLLIAETQWIQKVLLCIIRTQSLIHSNANIQAKRVQKISMIKNPNDWFFSVVTSFTWRKLMIVAYILPIIGANWQV